jgi:1-deoxyxylulose-5-phosphate synthase
VKYVNLGQTGLRVSRICLGMMSYGNGSDRAWVLDEDAAEPIVKAAVEGGITFFDTADVYSGGASEVATGRLLGKFGSRDEFVVATKVHGAMGAGENDRGLSRKHIMSGIDASLRRLNMDYVDLYQIHRWDSRTPIDETMQALDDVVRPARPGTSAPARCSPGSSPRRSTAPTPTAGPGSARCRTTTTCSTARKSGR